MGYLNQKLDKLINLILAIIPVTSWLLGGITRIMRGHLISGLLQLIIPPVTFVFWIVDIYHVATTGDIKLYA